MVLLFPGMRWASTMLLAVCCLVMSGCGAVGDPMPPLLDIPQATTALSAVQRGDRVLINWPAPMRTTEGVAPRPARLGPVKIYRMVFPDLKTNASEADLKN